MHAAFFMVAAPAVAVGGYRGFAGYGDRQVVTTDTIRITPAKIDMDGVDFMPTRNNVLFGCQIKRIAGAFSVIRELGALQRGWLPVLLWLCSGVASIGWLHDHHSGIGSRRNDGLFLGTLSSEFITSRARLILLSLTSIFAGCSLPRVLARTSPERWWGWRRARVTGNPTVSVM
jgi:carbon starvation protein